MPLNSFVFIYTFKNIVDFINEDLQLSSKQKNSPIMSSHGHSFSPLYPVSLSDISIRNIFNPLICLPFVIISHFCAPFWLISLALSSTSSVLSLTISSLSINDFLFSFQWLHFCSFNSFLVLPQNHLIFCHDPTLTFLISLNIINLLIWKFFLDFFYYQCY